MAGIFDDDRGVDKTPFTGQRPKVSAARRSRDKKVPSVLGIPLGDPKRTTAYRKGHGAAGVGAELSNFILDTWRGAANLGSDSADFALGRPAETQLGNRMFGRAPQPRKHGEAGRILSKTSQKLPPTEEVSEEVAPELSFADYLKMANEMSGGGADYSSLMAQLRSNAGEGDARLNAMYSQLQKSFADDAATIGRTYDETAAAQQAAAQAASTSIDAGYNSALDDQQRRFAELGIGDAAAAIAAGSGSTTNDRAFANANVQQLGNISQQQTQANKGSALNYNTQITQAAGAEGATQRALLQQQLGDRLAELQVRQSESDAQHRDSNWERASFLADWDNAAAQRRQGPDPKSEIETMILAEKLISLQAENAAAARGGTQSDPSALYAQMQSMAQQYGIDPGDQEAMGSFIEQMAATKKLLG